MIRDVVVALLTVKINEFDSTFGNVLSKRLVINELGGILDYIVDMPKEEILVKGEGKMKYTEEIADITYMLEQMQREITRLEQENEALKEQIKELEDKE